MEEIKAGYENVRLQDGSGNKITSSGGALDVNAVIVEDAIAPDGGTLPANVKVVAGYDGAAVQVLKTDANGELQIDVLSSALPVGAAVSSAQTDGSQKTQIVDGSGNVISSTLNALDVNLKSPITVDVSLSAANDDVLVYGFDGTSNQKIKTDANGELQIDVLSSALPTGAATSAAQTDGTQKSQIVDAAGDVADVKLLSVNLAGTDKGLVTNTIIHGETTGGGGGYVDVKVTPSGALTVESTLSGLDAAVLGQDTMANSLPVVIASDQSAIPVTDNGSSLTVDGSVSVSSSALPSGAATEVTLASLNTKMPSQGQALMAASVPVVIASNQSSLSVTPVPLSVVDLLDADILDTSVTNIPGSASSPVQVIASTAAEIKAIQLLDTTGAFVGVYVGGIGSEVLKFVMGPGSDQTIEHNIPAASRVSLKRLDATAAVSSGIVAFNCMG